MILVGEVIIFLALLAMSTSALLPKKTSQHLRDWGFLNKFYTNRVNSSEAMNNLTQGELSKMKNEVGTDEVVTNEHVTKAQVTNIYAAVNVTNEVVSNLTNTNYTNLTNEETPNLIIGQVTKLFNEKMTEQIDEEVTEPTNEDTTDLPNDEISNMIKQFVENNYGDVSKDRPYVQDLNDTDNPDETYCANNTLLPSDLYMAFPWWYNYCEMNLHRDEFKSLKIFKTGSNVNEFNSYSISQKYQFYKDTMKKINRYKKALRIKEENLVDSGNEIF